MSTKFEDLIGRGTTGSKPAAGVPGRLYYDTTLEQWERDTGVVWEVCEPSTPAAVDSSLLIYDNSVFKATGTSISFDDNLSVSVTGTSVFVLSTGGGATTLDDLTDVNISSPSTGQVLTYSGSEWVASSLSGSGGGDSIYTSAYADRPEPSNDGNLFLPSDGFFLQRDTGSSWVSFAPVYRFTAPPPLDEFTWVNQGSGTAEYFNETILLTTPALAGTQFRLLVKSSPTPPYTIKIAFQPLFTFTMYNSAGLALRESGTDKLLIFHLVYTKQLQIDYEVNPTTYGLSVSTVEAATDKNLIWLKMENDGTNRIYSGSPNGVDWIVTFTHSNTELITEDQVGIVVNSQSATYGTSMRLISWEIS